jgi:hypothetical protein
MGESEMELKLLPAPTTVYQPISHVYLRDKRTGEIYTAYDTYRLPDTGERVKLTVCTYYLPTPSGKTGRKCEYALAWKLSKGNVGRSVMLDDLDASLLVRVEL